MNYVKQRNKEECIGKKINFRASNNPCMFQVFKLFVHQTEKNEFYVDGTFVEDNPGVMVDFRNMEHTYELFQLFGNYWGGWNATPTSNEMCNMAKHWEEEYDAEIIGIGYDNIDFRIGRDLLDEEIDVLFDEIREINADANCRGGFEKLRTLIKENKEFYIWWD